ncbi:helix-turn-helix domain-containing protein [Corynebacterium casei]|uniref:helix-turn-helix domain-containing protein n=1 Tax=Corynebacterium casei TaxID=160386 RepID=UPI003FD068B4
MPGRETSTTPKRSTAHHRFLSVATAHRLSNRWIQAKQLINQGVPKSRVARELGISRSSIYKHIKTVD